MNRQIPRFLAGLGIAALVLAASVAVAAPLYGVRGNYGEGRSADLVEIDPTTGDMIQLFGPTGLDGVSGLAIDPTTGNLYAAVSGYEENNSNAVLYALDKLTGAATQVGSEYLSVKDMAFDSTGTLYAIDSNKQLVTVDLVSGGPTVIGTPATNATGGIGIAFDSSDQLYVKDKEYLYTVDPATAAILSTVPLDLPVGFPDDILRNSLAFDDNDVLYSMGWDFDVELQEAIGAILVTIDPATGVVTDLGGYIPASASDTVISAIDFARSSEEAAVPEPATLSLLALGGLALLRRRTRA